MTSERQTIRMCIGALCAVSFLVACAEEPPPRSANEFMENAILLEATMVRCAENRAEARYDAECINAREAVNRLAAAREQAKRQDLEAQSERKRQALRRAQEAAAEARRRARDEEDRRRDAELHGVFEPLPDERPDDEFEDESGNDQAARPLSPPAETPTETPTIDDPDNAVGNASGGAATPARLPDASTESAPPAVAPSETTGSSDLEAIRRELERRQGESAEQ